jgi:exonuclease VII small subunit
MKETNVQEEELLVKLSEIYNQLEKLDCALHSSILEYKEDCQAELVKRMSVCEEKLSVLETKMGKIDEQESGFARASGVILELGYSYSIK